MFENWDGDIPSDVVGIVFEGTWDMVAREKTYVAKLAENCGSVEFVGPEPIRSHYADRNWDGNTKAHEDSGASYCTDWVEPIFYCRVDQYPEARALTLKKANENGFTAGKNYWRGTRLGKRSISNYPCALYNAADRQEVVRAGKYYNDVLNAAITLGAYRSLATQSALNESHIPLQVIQVLKETLDPHNIMPQLY
jgi:hypothetical protein